MIIAASAAVLLLAAPQSAPQTAPQTPPPGADITRNLNSGPPRPAEYLAPEPEPEPAPEAEAAPATAVQPAPAPTPRQPAAAPNSAPVTPPASEPAAAPAPRAAEPEPKPAPTPAPVRPAPTPAPTPAPARPAATLAPAPAAEAPPPPSVPAVTVLDAAARAALPFSVDLPAGFELVTGRPGPDFRIYTIRRGDRSFAMVYAGPASQFPIYSGEVLEAGGRATVVSTEDGMRHAREHLFQRPEGTTPREIHVWTMSLDGADRALAERIAQSVDAR
ncbi:MAG: hypothetical protein IR159_02300 [Brevundimonas sp.]|nr:hypothetical protein [Brevundimonas sp.]